MFVGFVALFVPISKTAAVSQDVVSVCLLCMKLEGLSPQVLHCTLTEFSPVHFLTAYFVEILFDISLVLANSFHVGTRTEFCMNFLCICRCYIPRLSQPVSELY